MRKTLVHANLLKRLHTFIAHRNSVYSWYRDGTLVSTVFCRGASVVPQLCLNSVLPPVPLKCPEISSLTLRFCTKNMINMMAQRCLLVQLSVIQFLSNVPR